MSNSKNVACFGSDVVTMGGQIYWTKRQSLTARVVGRMQMVVRVCTGVLKAVLWTSAWCSLLDTIPIFTVL